MIIKLAINKNNHSFELNCPTSDYPTNNFSIFRAINILKVIFIFLARHISLCQRDFLQEVEASHSDFVKLTLFIIFIDMKDNSATIDAWRLTCIPPPSLHNLLSYFDEH